MQIKAIFNVNKMNGVQVVVGSNPITPTKIKPLKLPKSCEKWHFQGLFYFYPLPLKISAITTKYHQKLPHDEGPMKELQSISIINFFLNITGRNGGIQ